MASAENGRIALDMLRAEPYDLMLLDMEMPELDGFGVLEQLKQDGKLRDLPVIVTSSREGLAHVVRCRELGADDYLRKPVNPVLLKARINSSLEKKRLRDRQKALIARCATSEVAEDLQQSGLALGGRRLCCTVMFNDIRGFTSLCEKQSPEETIELLNTCYTLMFDAINGHGGLVNQTIGDGLTATRAVLAVNAELLFVDKNLRYHGLLQAFSRTNRIFDATKTFGNIVTFRDLEQATIDAITLFGDKNTKNVVLEKSYKEYMDGLTDLATGEARRGFVDVVRELEQRFPDPAAIEREADKKAFVKLFGEYLRVENVLQNYDEFASLKALQGVDLNDPVAVEVFKAKHYLDDGALAALREIHIPPERIIQDYRSTYNDVRDWQRGERSSAEKAKSDIDRDDVVFEVDLLKSQEINLDYILELIFENNRKVKDKAALVEDVRRVIRASLGNRAKESLLVDFINQTDLDKLGEKATVIHAFFTFAQAEQQHEAQELIIDENLNANAAKRYITTSLKREFASDSRHAPPWSCRVTTSGHAPPRAPPAAGTRGRSGPCHSSRQPPWPGEWTCRRCRFRSGASCPRGWLGGNRGWAACKAAW